MQAHIENIRNRFDDLNNREKLLVTSGTITLVILLFIFLILLPSYKKADNLRNEITLNTEDVAWMKSTSILLKSNNTSSSFTGINRSLLALLDEQFKSAGLSDSVKSINPEGKNKAKIRLENCSFDKLITLIGTLENSNNVIVMRTNFKSADEVGRINGNITFSRG